MRGGRGDRSSGTSSGREWRSPRVWYHLPEGGERGAYTMPRLRARGIRLCDRVSAVRTARPAKVDPPPLDPAPPN
jgi:hypothetical protein